MGRGRNKSGQKWRAKVARVAKRVTLQNQETKCYSFVGANTTSGGTGLSIPIFSEAGSTTGVASPYIDLPLDNIDAGTGQTQRIGTHIILKGMQYNMEFQQDPNNLFQTKIRVIVAWIDPNFNISTITNGNVLDSPQLAGNSVINAQLKGPSRPDTIMRKVVSDRTFVINTGNAPISTASNVPRLSTRHVKMRVPFHNKNYQFINTSGGAGGEKEELAVFVFGWAAGQVNTVQVSNLKVSARVYYKDG